MNIVLLERIETLGRMGDVVRVKNGYARNFLLPKGKALRATKENMARFEADRQNLEARSLERRSAAERDGEQISGKTFIIIRQAGDAGQLYGSVTPRDIAALLEESGVVIHREQVVLERPIKALGLHELRVCPHPEVSVPVVVNVARTEDEAVRQARGEDVTSVEMESGEVVDVDSIFEDPEQAEAALAAETEADDGDTSDSDGDSDGGSDGGSDSGGESADASPESPAEATPS